MTGFDETVPPDDDIDRDEHAAGDPKHDSVAPAFAVEPDPDEVPSDENGRPPTPHVD
jgi:hypothetical protein